MSQKYAAYGDDGAITGFYDSVDSPVPEGVTAIEITDEQWLTCIGQSGDWIVVDGRLVHSPRPGPSLDDIKSSLVNSIDNMVATVYSSWTRFQAEYEQREAAAQAFKDAGYTGNASVWVSAFATSAGKTLREAADLILAQSVSLRGALATLGALRMRKYEVLAAESESAARAAYDDIATAIEAAAASID